MEKTYRYKILKIYMVDIRYFSIYLYIYMHTLPIYIYVYLFIIMLFVYDLLFLFMSVVRVSVVFYATFTPGFARKDATSANITRSSGI